MQYIPLPLADFIEEWVYPYDVLSAIRSVLCEEYYPDDYEVIVDYIKSVTNEEDNNSWEFHIIDLMVKGYITDNPEFKGEVK